MYLTAIRVFGSLFQTLGVLFLILCAASAASAQENFRFERAETKIILSEKRGELIFAVRAARQTENGQLTLEVLDAENKIIAQSSQNLSLAAGLNLIDSKLISSTASAENSVIKTLAENSDFLTYRLRFRLEAAGATALNETFSFARIAPMLFDLRIAAADADIIAGNNYYVRVQAFESRSQIPLSGVNIHAVVTLDFEDDREPDKTKIALDAVTDKDGFASLTFPLPAERKIEDGELEISGRFQGVEIAHSEDLDFDENSRAAFYLSADKPIYQPGQMLNVRGVLLDKMRHAKADTKLKVKIESPDDDTMFAAEIKTSRFGVASF